MGAEPFLELLQPGRFRHRVTMVVLYDGMVMLHRMVVVVHVVDVVVIGLLRLIHLLMVCRN